MLAQLMIPGLSSSYIIVRLPDNVPTRPQELRVKLRGAASDPKMLNHLRNFSVESLRNLTH